MKKAFSLNKTFRAVDFATVADVDGNGVAEFAVLGVDADGRSKVELRDSRSGALVNNLWSGSSLTSAQLAEVPDTNGNGSPEIAILQLGNPQVAMRTADSRTDDPLGFVHFNPNFDPRRVAVLPDLDGNGSPEVAVLGLRRMGWGRRVLIQDAATNATRSTLNF